jgi:tRNA dimethylallyltransferase
MSGKKQSKASNNNVTVIVGPTCTGKTSMALKLCKESGGQIISADSRQVYKHMDVGTGKAWGEGVTIWGYDLVEPDQYFSAHDFAKYALAKISELITKNIPVYLVGGTGLYIDLVTGSLKLDAKGPDFELRKGLEKKTLGELQSQLSKLDPVGYAKIDRKNPVRLIRAVEKCLSKNKTQKLDFPNVSYTFLGLTAENTALFARSDTWLDSIWGDKFFKEVTFLLKKYPTSDKLKGFIYKSAVSALVDENTAKDALQRAKFDTHAYIRRQLTWFKRNPQINWISIEKSAK